MCNKQKQQSAYTCCATVLDVVCVQATNRQTDSDGTFSMKREARRKTREAHASTTSTLRRGSAQIGRTMSVGDHRSASAMLELMLPLN